MKHITFNRIEWTSDICHMFIERLESEVGNTLIVPDVDEEELAEMSAEEIEEVGTRYNEQGQDIFNELYDEVEDYLMKRLGLDAKDGCEFSIGVQDE